MRFPHVTLPSSIVRELGPCMLQRDDLRFLREVILPKLRRGSIVLPAQPRYRLGGSMAATGGWMFVVRARHRIGAVVARIGIGWRDHGASLVWRECVGDPNEEPSRAWVVDILDPTEFFSLNHHEVLPAGAVGARAGSRPRVGGGTPWHSQRQHRSADKTVSCR